MDTLSQSRPKARKDHTCNYCNGKIKAGEIYENSTHVYDGEIYTWKNHLDCHKLAVELDMFEDYCLTGDDFCDIVSEHFFDFIATDYQNYKNTPFQERLKAVKNKYLNPLLREV